MPFKMKGSPMYRNFGIGSSPVRDVTKKEHPHLDEEQKVHPQKQDAEGGENPNDSAEGEGGFWNDLWDNSVLGQVVDAGKKGEIGDNLKEAYLGDNSIIGGTVKGIKQFRTNKKNEKIVDEKIKQEDLKKKTEEFKKRKKTLLETDKGTAKGKIKPTIKPTVKPTVKTV